VGAVLVHIDFDGDRLHPSSLVALATGRTLASTWGATLYAALIVHDGNPGDDLAAGSTANLPGVARYQSDLSAAGADKVVVATTRANLAPLWSALGGAWSVVLAHIHPRLVLFGADAPAAGELGPRTAARLSARFLSRARAVTRDQLVELRDHGGGYARESDSGATVALVGGRRAASMGSANADLLLVVADSAGDPNVEIVRSAPADVTATSRAVIALDETATVDAALNPDVMRLATLFDAPIVRAGQLPPTSPLAPDLIISLGTPAIDVAGASAVVRIAGASSKNVDAALPAPLGEHASKLRHALEDA
jgi:hypothetical protein